MRIDNVNVSDCFLQGPEERLVNHLHFREWPDFGCPASPKHVLQFCITLRRQAVLFPGKIVVHCR